MDGAHGAPYPLRSATRWTAPTGRPMKPTPWQGIGRAAPADDGAHGAPYETNPLARDRAGRARR
jgi:hypothetical protein